MVPHPRHASQRDRPFEHLLGLYEHEAFLTRSVAEFALPALRAQAMAVVVLTPERLRAVDVALVAAGIDPDAARDRGEYITLDADACLDRILVGGRVDHERFYAFAAGVLDVAAERGCEIRIGGQMAPELWRRGDGVGALHLEELWNTLPNTPRFDLLCMYPVHAFDGAEHTPGFSTLCDLHAEVIPDESYTSLTEPADRRRLFAGLQQQRRAADRDRERLQAQLGELEATLATVTEQARRHDDQLHRAIETRDAIGQAKGILMARFRIDSDTAFRMLQAASGRSHLKLRDVALVVIHQQLRRN
jgi:hypothetical protein